MNSIRGGRGNRPILGGLCSFALLLFSPLLVAQEQVATPADGAVAAPATGEGQGREPEAGAYVPAIDLLPSSVAGLVRIPNLPRFCEAWDKTYIGQLLDDESMKPYIESQRERAINYLESFGSQVGLRPQDLYDIASGEVVVVWQPFENDKRRPFAICVLADVRGRRDKADQAIAKIDSDLKSGGWERTDVTHRQQNVWVYNNKPKPGQLKVEQIAIFLDDTRIIAADRESVVTDLLDAVAGEPKSTPISQDAEFKSVLSRSAQAIRKPVQDGGGIISGEWFARPFQMGRIVRESLEIDRGNDLDILKLLENQGFNAVKSAGGVFSIAGNRYDILHRGFVLAPPTTDQPERYKQAARMLQFPNHPLAVIPAWVHEDAATFNRLNIDIENAFWASETLINEALGDEIFRDIIDGIRDDEDGPQIDIAKVVLPNLDDQLIVITDNTVPADLQSERMLLAIRVRDAQALKLSVRKAMEVEPDAKLLDDLPGTEIWRVERGESNEEFDPELFKDLEIGLEDEKVAGAPPLLDHWAIAVIDQGPGSDSSYLMFSSHSDLLILAARRIQQGAAQGLGTQPSIEKIRGGLQDLGCTDPAFDRAVRLNLSLRAKYELLRQGKLKESGSILASLYRRFLQDVEQEQDDPLEAETLPPLEVIEKYLPSGGSYFETTEDGWSMTGFLLK